MDRDIIIGKGNKGSSAYCLFDEDQNDIGISANGTSYWIHDAYLGIGMTIFKNTPEGKKLGNMIETHDLRYREYLEDLVLQYVDKKKLKEAVSHAILQSFVDGAKNKAKEIRKLLYIE